MRIKSRWHNKQGTHSVEDIAGALAFILMKSAMNGALNMEKADFQTETQQDRINIITEFLAFSIHMADRMTIEKFDENERVIFMTELAKKCAKHLEDNMRDLVGPGDYQQDFIDLLNSRMAEYAEFDYTEEGPSFSMKRYFGEKIKDVMKEVDKQWVGQQIIDIEVPEIMTHLRRSTPNLFK